MDALAQLQQLLNLSAQPPLRPEDYAQFRQRMPLSDVGVQNGGVPPPSPFDLPGGSSGRLDQPSSPLNLRPVPTQSQLPLSLMGGGYSMGKRFGQTSEPLNLQAAYNLPGLPVDVSGGSSLRPGRGLGGVDLRAYLRMPF